MARSSEAAAPRNGLREQRAAGYGTYAIILILWARRLFSSSLELSLHAHSFSSHLVSLTNLFGHFDSFLI
jgi:hypothetical protein